MFKILKINKKVNIGPQKARFIRANFTNDQLKEYLKNCSRVISHPLPPNTEVPNENNYNSFRIST